MLTTELIERGARRFPDRIAINYNDNLLSFKDANALANRLGNALRETCQLSPGTRVALLLNNSLYTIPLDFACVKARIIRVPLNSRLSAQEHVGMLRGMNVTTVICGPELIEHAKKIREVIFDLRILTLGATEEGGDLLTAAERQAHTAPAGEVDPGDVVLALYTSGTTGTLKAVEHTQASYAAVTVNILNNLIRPKSVDSMLHAASMIHASGTFVLPLWVNGGASIIQPSFTPEGYLEAIRHRKPTMLNLVPTMIGMLLEHPGISVRDFESVHTILYGASPMPLPLLEKALNFFGPRLAQYYGQTEAPLCITALSKEDHAPDVSHRRLACGYPSSDCEIRLLDENRNPVPAGQPGEITVRAPFMMKGYHNARELNEEHFLPGGWLRTRDVGYFDEEGYLYLIDRVSEMIVSGGYNVFPREVEDILSRHPAVFEAVVVGLPDDKWGEVVTGFVVVRQGYNHTTEQELVEYARQNIAHYKAPKSIHFIPEVPKSAVGKPLRRVIREPYWAGRARRI